MNDLPSMEFSRAGREYAKWTVTTPDALTSFQVQMVDGGPWFPMAYSGGVVSILVYGPECTDTSEGVLVAVPCRPSIQCTDTPEIVIRQDGWIIPI